MKTNPMAALAEINRLDLRGAIREGYAKALSTIIDANVTNLIVCFVLFKTATAEVKGFALTLKYLEGEIISKEELIAGLRVATIQGDLVPVLTGSSLKKMH